MKKHYHIVIILALCLVGYSACKKEEPTPTSSGGGNNSTVTCNDSIQNGTETGIDCGGSICPPCPTGEVGFVITWDPLNSVSNMNLVHVHIGFANSLSDANNGIFTYEVVSPSTSMSGSTGTYNGFTSPWSSVYTLNVGTYYYKAWNHYDDAPYDTGFTPVPLLSLNSFTITDGGSQTITLF